MKAASSDSATRTLDLAELTLREVNQILHDAPAGGDYRIVNPRGAHAVAAGLTTDVTVEVRGSVGYYGAGMHQAGAVTINGNAGTGVAENIMSGFVRVTGNATMSVGATGCGGLVVVEGNAGGRCGISMKGVDIVIGGNVGDMAAFMAQAGNLVILGDAGHHLGDSLYEANLFVRGSVASLGADCEAKDLGPDDRAVLAELLERSGLAADPDEFTRYGSARTLYNFHVDDIDAELSRGGHGS